ncbi:MAG: ribosome maturation factor RimP [Acidobacteria bacterium]|nr:ribosome maturation factor RimP [Acidobacteriota bacterium]
MGYYVIVVTHPHLWAAGCGSTHQLKLDLRVQELVEKVVTRQDLELVHVEMAGGHSPILRVYIDKPGGVTVEDCAAVSERLSLHLDVEDFIPTNYLLEVASPGLDRGLYKAADYERFAGLPAHIKLEAPLNGQRNFHGKLIGLNQTGALADEPTVILEDETGQQHRLPLAQIAKANVEIEP